ncbi:MAG: DMT family transporter, partial [Pseudoxanthomonas sp.]
MNASSIATAAPPRRRAWLAYALATVALWGVWGALAGLSAQHGFPDTLVYCVWALTMVPPALYILWRSGWRLERSPRALAYGLTIGLLGAGGQMLLFHTLTIGPAYFVFPIISLSPVVTIALSFLFLRERTGWMGALGIALALVALPLLDLSFGRGAGEGLGWFLQSLLIMLAWGVQAYFMRLANDTVRAESIFFYMMLGALLLAPVAWAMTDWNQPINLGLDGPWMTAAIQLLNAVGALTLVYAFRYGKAIVVAPLTNAGAPLITAV